MNGLFTNISLLRKWEHTLKVTCDDKLIYSLEKYPNGRNPRDIPQNVVDNFNKLYINDQSLYDTYYKKKHGVDFQSGTLLFTIKNELIIATKDLRRRIGILFLYVDSLYRISENPTTVNGKIWYQYNPTQFDDAYNLEIPIAFEAIYKFWQRVSDLIMIFLPYAMAEKKRGNTYFETPFLYTEKHLSELKESVHYQWLLQFWRESYPELNRHRKYFVHNLGYTIDFFRRFIKDNSNIEVLRKLDKERGQWPEYLKAQSELCIKGYYECIDFLSQITISIESGKLHYALSN